MQVKELIEELKTYPEDAEVFIGGCCGQCYSEVLEVHKNQNANSVYLDADYYGNKS